MYKRFLKTPIQTKSLARVFSDSVESARTLIGGGLDKPQGGLKEEDYFQKQNYELISKIRDQKDDKLKCENCIPDNSLEFDKALPPPTLSTNKHKNCLEEAFFLNEHNECCRKISKENLTESNVISDGQLHK